MGYEYTHNVRAGPYLEKVNLNRTEGGWEEGGKEKDKEKGQWAVAYHST